LAAQRRLTRSAKSAPHRRVARKSRDARGIKTPDKVRNMASRIGRADKHGTGRKAQGKKLCGFFHHPLYFPILSEK